MAAQKKRRAVEVSTIVVRARQIECWDELGSRQAVFDANEALTAMAQYVVIGNVGDVVRVLDYLVSIGTLETVERETPDGPARWRYIG